ncbi:MAG: cysteine hydrolase family protein [Azospirillaceae bacterium]
MQLGGPAALVVIDLQQAIDDPVWGRRGQPGAEAAVGALLTAWRGRGWPVVHVRHDSLDPASPYAPEKPGNAFKPVAEPLPDEIVVPKRTNSAFIGTDLVDRLEAFAVGDLVVVGVLLENSVEATVRMAGNLGYHVWLPGDACASIDRTDHRDRHWPAEDVHALTLAILDGEYATVTTTKELIAALA